jgi:hypothetical protein
LSVRQSSLCAFSDAPMLPGDLGSLRLAREADSAQELCERVTFDSPRECTMASLLSLPWLKNQRTGLLQSGRRTTAHVFCRFDGPTRALERLRRCPPQSAHRRRREWYAQVLGYSRSPRRRLPNDGAASRIDELTHRERCLRVNCHTWG